MAQQTIAWVFLVAYVLVMLWLGLKGYRASKTLEGFFLAGRKLGPWIISFSFFATLLSTSAFLGGGGTGFLLGFAWPAYLLMFNIIFAVIPWIFIAPRMRVFTEKLKSITIPDYFSFRYENQTVRVVASVIILIALEFHGGFATCPRIRDLPIIARRSRRDGTEVRRALGLPLDRPLALVSFGGYGVEELDPAVLAEISGYGVVMPGSTPIGDSTLQARGRLGSLMPLDEPAMYARGYRYEDVVKAVDVVVSKPGHGIIAECAANDTALLYTSRGHFAEYDVLVQGMPRYLRTGFIDQAALFAGAWAPALDAVLAQPARTPRRWTSPSCGWRRASSS